MRVLRIGGWLFLPILLICAGAVSAAQTEQVSKPYAGKKILWIDSYHVGYPWCDGIGRGIQRGLTGSGVELKMWHMDTDRNRSEVYRRQAGILARTLIEEYRPDVVIVSDDNAQKYLVVPFLKDTDLPVVFCGVNRDPAEYGYPCRNVTGMREVDFTETLVAKMENFAGGDRIGLLAGDTETDRIMADYYSHSSHPFHDRLKVYLVRTFDEFKQAVVRAQREVDILNIRTNAGIAGWDDDAAEAFLMEHNRIPTGSVLSWMKNFVIFDLAKQPEEQGEYAARTALKILGGTRPENLPIKTNKHAHLSINLKMAKAAGIVLPVSMLQTAEVIGQEALQD